MPINGLTGNPPMTSVANWQYKQLHVAENLEAGNFISAESVLVCAGKPRLSDGSMNFASQVQAVDFGNELYPMGVLENVMISQNNALQKLFEIGSARSYFIPGRVIGAVTIGRILYHGPSLMRVLYAAYGSDDPIMPIINPNPFSTGQAPINLVPGSQTNPIPTVAPGSGQFYINMTSELFKRPVGLSFIMKDQLSLNYGMFYLEDCYIQGHQFSISATSMLIAEGVSMQFDRVVPIELTEDQLKASGGAAIYQATGF